MKTLFKIYQIKDIPEVKYAFRDYKFAQAHGLTFGDYEQVESGELDSNKFEGKDWDETVFNMLEGLFDNYNLSIDKYPHMHSLSISDIVQINDMCYYCDFSGWVKM